VKWKEGQELDVKAEEHVAESEDFKVNMESAAENRAVRVDISQEGGAEFVFGKETLMVNASIMTLTYKPWNSPWLVDMDLMKAG
jgi:hypothetical protein